MLRAADCWDNDAHKQVAEYSSYLLWRFIQRSARESEAEEAFLNLTGLSKNDLNTLANIRFLLSAESPNFHKQYSAADCQQAVERIHKRARDSPRMCARTDRLAENHCQQSRRRKRQQSVCLLAAVTAFRPAGKQTFSLSAPAGKRKKPAALLPKTI